MNFTTYVLLLDKRLSQRERITNDFLAKGLAKPNFFLAGDGSQEFEKYDHIDVVPPPRSGYRAWVERPNSYNAFLCFRKMIGQAQKNRVQCLAICEDDVSLRDNFNEVLAKAEEELKFLPDWDLLYFCSNHTWKPTTQLSEHIIKLNGSGGFQFILMKNHMFEPMLKLPMENPIDDVVARYLHGSYNCYAVFPNIAIPISGYSFCEGYEYDNTHLYFNKGCNH